MTGRMRSFWFNDYPRSAVEARKEGRKSVLEGQDVARGKKITCNCGPSERALCVLANPKARYRLRGAC